MRAFEWLQGKKSYIVAAGAIITAVGAYLNKSISLTELVQSIFAATSVATLRAGIAKCEPPKPTSGYPSRF